MASRSGNRTLKPAGLIGVPLGIGLVLAGQWIEGGGPGTLVQGAAAIVVFGGTLGAVLVSFPIPHVLQAVVALRRIMVDDHEPAGAVIQRFVALATRARRSGIVSLEEDLEVIHDPFLRRGLMLAIDGSSGTFIRDTLHFEMDAADEADEMPARVFESAGGYAPTLGILGAVLGLIHVMQNLADPSRLGPGIAVAFVATVYGVGSANLIFLPLGTRLRHVAREAARRRELLLEGILAIQEGLNPRLVEQRLASFAPGSKRQDERSAPAVPVEQTP